MPLTKPWFLGIANIRGNLYSVIDFAALSRVARASRRRPAHARLVLFGPRAGDIERGARRARACSDLRNVAELAPAAPPQDAPAWYAQRWMDGDGNAWQEIDLAIARARIRRSCRSDLGRGGFRRAEGEKHMALKFGNLFGGDKAKTSGADDLDMPTTQVKMAQAAQAGYDPLASVSIMEQLRTAHREHRRRRASFR